MTILTLVEGLPKYEGINEAAAISDALNIMKKSLDGRRKRHLHIYSYTAKNANHFLRLLEHNTDFLHISSHGTRKNGNTILEITKNGTITTDDIKQRDIKARVIFVNACQTSRIDLANSFFDAGNYKHKYFIAPFKEVPFDEAFIVALLFYRKAFLQKISLNDSNKLFKALEYAYKLKDISTNYFFWDSEE